MIARPARPGVRARGQTGVSPAALLVAVLLVFPARLSAQSEPTPFWLPPPDAPAETPAKKKPPARKRTPTAPKPHAPAAPDDDSSEERAPAPPKRAEKKRATGPQRKRVPAEAAPGSEPKRAQPAREVEPESEAEPAVSAPPAPIQKHRYQPLPPIPHIEPAPPVAHPAPSRAPILPPGSAPAPAQPAAPPTYPPTYPSNQSPSAPNYQPNQPSYPTYPPYPPPGSPQQGPSSRPAPAPRPVPINEQRAAHDDPGEPEESGVVAPRLRRFSLELVGGVWGKAVSDGQGFSWQLAYGAELGFALFRWLQLDVRAIRAGGQDGNAYVNATVNHLLFDARLFAVWNLGPLALFAGGGGGAAFEQTQLFLQDVGGTPTQLSSSGMEPLATFAGGARLRPWRGLTLRLEVDGVVREGNLEPLFLLGAGWAF